MNPTPNIIKQPDKHTKINIQITMIMILLCQNQTVTSNPRKTTSTNNLLISQTSNTCQYRADVIMWYETRG